MKKSQVTVKKTAAGTLSMMAGDIQIEMDAGGVRPETLMESLEERFKRADRDNNGYLEQNESNRDVFFRNHFKKYDTDGDRKALSRRMAAAGDGCDASSPGRTRG